MKFGTLVKQSQHFNRDYFHDNWCPICDFMEFREIGEEAIWESRFTSFFEFIISYK